MPVFQGNQIDNEQNSDPTKWTDLRGLTLEIPMTKLAPNSERGKPFNVVATLTVPRPYLRGKGYASGYFGIAIGEIGEIKDVQYAGEVGYAISSASDSHAWPTCQPISITCHFAWKNDKDLKIVPKWRLGLGNLMTVDSYRALIVSIEPVTIEPLVGILEPVTVPFSFPIGGKVSGIYPPDHCGQPDHGKPWHEQCP